MNARNTLLAYETVKVFSFLASPFVKGGSRGIFINHRPLIFNDYYLIDPISPNPSLLKRGNNKNTFTASYARKALFRSTIVGANLTPLQVATYLYLAWACSLRLMTPASA